MFKMLLCYYRNLSNRWSIQNKHCPITRNPSSVMRENDWTQMDIDTADQGTPEWIERARRMAEYHSEALGFIDRASEHFATNPEHAQLLMRLWVEADILDGMVLQALDDLNVGLLDGQGELDTTRGVTMQPSALGVLSDVSADEEIIYECIWSLIWGAGLGVSVTLSANDNIVFQVQARGTSSLREHRVGYPVTIGALQDALVDVYVAEATSM